MRLFPKSSFHILISQYFSNNIGLIKIIFKLSYAICINYIILKNNTYAYVYSLYTHIQQFYTFSE